MNALRLALLGIAVLLGWAAQADESRPFVGGSWRVILQAHAGHPTVVHFWGLTCGPCRIEMPKWGKRLAQRHDFDFVTVDTDPVTGAPGQADAFLAASNVPKGEAWHFADPFAEKLYFQVDPLWQGEIPITILIGRNGETRRLTGAVDMADVDKWLAQQDRR